MDLIDLPFTPSGRWWKRMFSACYLAYVNYRLRQQERPTDQDLLAVVSRVWEQP